MGAIFGGPCAIFGSFLAMGYIGGVFAAVSCLVYPIVGAGLARIFVSQRRSRAERLGIFIIVGGAIYIYAPGILDELTGAGSSSWLGYLGGFMAAVGWGVEGAVGGRALDVSDPDVGVSIRFMVEPLYWVFIIIPITILLAGSKVTDLIMASFTPTNLVFFMTIGITFGYCTIAWYKAFPLIGVGRTQAISDSMAIWAVAFLSIFTLTLPQVNYWVGGIVVILGGVVVFGEPPDARLHPVGGHDDRRDQDGAGSGLDASRGGAAVARLHVKGRRTARCCRPTMLWVAELAERVAREYGLQGEYWYGNTRLTMADLSSNGLVEDGRGEDRSAAQLRQGAAAHEVQRDGIRKRTDGRCRPRGGRRSHERKRFLGLRGRSLVERGHHRRPWHRGAVHGADFRAQTLGDDRRPAADRLGCLLPA